MSSAHRPTVLLLIPHLGGGGSEHVIETLARSLNSSKYDIHLALITTSQRVSPSLSSFVSVHALGVKRVRRAVFGLLRLIWRLRPNLMLSGISHLNLLVLGLKPLLPRTTRIVVRQNGALAASLAAYPRILSRAAHSFSYRRADRIVCQTDSMALEIHRGLAVEQSKLLVLPNPTDISHIRRKSLEFSEQITTSVTVLAIGRLVREKGFDILLHAFALLSGSPQLIIVGSGPEQCRLEALATELDIRDRVQFPGYVPDPVVRFRQSTLFVLSSRTEGLPNAMLEAAAAGLPIVATPAFSGIDRLLSSREGVWLAEEISPDSLRIALQTALRSIRTGVRYRHAWVEPFDLSHAIPAYEAAMDEVLVEAC